MLIREGVSRLGVAIDEQSTIQIDCVRPSRAHHKNTICGGLYLFMTMHPLPTDSEPVWSQWLADRMGGVAEYVLPDRSRVDILTPLLAIEVDWVKKWPEAIGQAVFYGIVTERQPAVLLLLRGKPSEQRYLDRARLASDRLGIAVFTWLTIT